MKLTITIDPKEPTKSTLYCAALLAADNGDAEDFNYRYLNFAIWMSYDKSLYIFEKNFKIFFCGGVYKDDELDPSWLEKAWQFALTRHEQIKGKIEKSAGLLQASQELALAQLFTGEEREAAV